MKKIIVQFKISQRRACRIIGQARSTQRRRPIIRDDEDSLRKRIIELTCCYGRYGYRRITALLHREGWKINHKRVERIWHEEGLKIPQKQKKKGRIWLNDGSCIRLRPEHKNHVWSYDFVFDRTNDGKQIKILTLIDEYTRECLYLFVSRKITSQEVIDVLYFLFITKGIPDYIRSDNGSEFTANILILWLSNIGVKTKFIEPGSPWENGYIESFNGKLRDEVLNRERFDNIVEARVIIENWKYEYNNIRPHSALGYRPPAPEVRSIVVRA